jgi:ubiquinone/menaquinone biosynthesis C-methylase UbiE
VKPFQRALGEIDGGRVLDVATGRGGFVEFLADALRSYSQIVGVDLSTRMMADALENVDSASTHFVQMDAGRMGLADGGFDTVSLSASLHHLADAAPVLAEIERVAKPGGTVVIAEMHRDATTEAQMTSVLIHHWAAAVDEALGWPHYPTLSRQRIVDLVGGLGLQGVAVYDRVDEDSDPQDRARIQALQGVFERYLQRAQGFPEYVAFETQAGELRGRLRDVGAQDEPRVAVTGRKPG